MSRIRIIYAPGGEKIAEYRNGDLIFSKGHIDNSGVLAPMVMPDIQPYKSMINGQMITSRSQHRTHLRDHGCIEVGNETKHLKSYGDHLPSGQKDAIIETMRKMKLL